METRCNTAGCIFILFLEDEASRTKVMHFSLNTISNAVPVKNNISLTSETKLRIHTIVAGVLSVSRCSVFVTLFSLPGINGPNGICDD